MNEEKELIMNADVAFENEQYETALDWYKKALESEPQNIYALSRAGAISAHLEDFDGALKYFEEALKIDPENGDNHFNYGNALFFKGDLTGAFQAYVKAERVGCSDEITARLYYQMAMLCSARQDVKSALVYFQKSEDADTNHIIGMEPDMISERLKIYMYTESYDKAAECAAELVAINPTELRNYIVYFSILMALADYKTAEKVLSDAEKYVELTDSDKINLMIQKASYYITIAEKSDNSSELILKAKDAVDSALNNNSCTKDNKAQLLLTLAEINLKEELYDECLLNLNNILSLEGVEVTAEAVELEKTIELTEDALDEMLAKDIESIEEKIYNGEMDANAATYAEEIIDENGEVYYALDSTLKNEPALVDGDGTSSSAEYKLAAENKDRVYFIMLSCYVAKDDFENARKIAPILSASSNKYYQYFGRYTDTLAMGKLNPSTEETKNKYDETIAFFTSKMIEDRKDTFAAIFRARLYVEQGKYLKAEEIATLLDEDSRQSILDYINSCKK